MRLSPVIVPARRRPSWFANLSLIVAAAIALDLVIICLWSSGS